MTKPNKSKLELRSGAFKNLTKELVQIAGGLGGIILVPNTLL
jgi:hypothetical protein